MGGDSLQSYIQQKLSAGYTTQGLYQYLLSQGYKAEQLNPLFQQTSIPKEKGSFRLVLFSTLMVLIIVLGGAAVILVDTDDVPELLSLDIKSVIITESYEQGKPIDVRVEIVDPSGSRDGYQVYLSHRILADDGSLVFFTQETLRLAGSKIANRKLFIPKDTQVGSYILETEATVGEKTFSSSFSFSIERYDPILALGGDGVGDRTLPPSFRIIPEEETRRNRILVKQPTLPEGRGITGLTIERLGPA